VRALTQVVLDGDVVRAWNSSGVTTSLTPGVELAGEISPVALGAATR
jgi:hypothetical protein